MKTEDYENEVRRTAVGVPAEELLGLVGEAGEVADLLKKVLFHGRELDRGALVKELGDAHWYWTAIRLRHGITLEEVEETNVAKLRKRYPDGWSAEASAARVDTTATVEKVKDGGAVLDIVKLTNVSGEVQCRGCGTAPLRDVYILGPLSKPIRFFYYCSPACLRKHEGGAHAASAP